MQRLEANRWLPWFHYRVLLRPLYSRTRRRFRRREENHSDPSGTTNSGHRPLVSPDADPSQAPAGPRSRRDPGTRIAPSVRRRSGSAGAYHDPAPVGRWPETAAPLGSEHDLGGRGPPHRSTTRPSWARGDHGLTVGQWVFEVRKICRRAEPLALSSLHLGPAGQVGWRARPAGRRCRGRATRGRSGAGRRGR